MSTVGIYPTVIKEIRICSTEMIHVLEMLQNTFLDKIQRISLFFFLPSLLISSEREGKSEWYSPAGSSHPDPLSAFASQASGTCAQHEQRILGLNLGPSTTVSAPLSFVLPLCHFSWPRVFTMRISLSLLKSSEFKLVFMSIIKGLGGQFWPPFLVRTQL